MTSAARIAIGVPGYMATALAEWFLVQFMIPEAAQFWVWLVVVSMTAVIVWSWILRQEWA